MTLFALLSPTIFTGEELLSHHAILIREGIIEKITPTTSLPPEYQPINIKGMITPGFIDLQVNGGGGVLFNNSPQLDTLKIMASAHLNLGTHFFLPTLITAQDKLIHQALDSVEEARAQKIPGILGIHLEGPMIHPKRRGIHNKEAIHTLPESLLTRLCQANGRFGYILITLAPERVSPTLIQRLTAANITVFAGHTDATPKELEQAKEAGLQGFTHLYNAMAPMESRRPRTVGYALMADELFCTLIHDGYHVDPLMVKLALRLKPKEKRILITDAMATVGMNPNNKNASLQFILDEKVITLKEGRLVDKQGTLAGAHLSLSQAVMNTVNLGIPLEEAIQMVTTNPIKALSSNYSKQVSIDKFSYKTLVGKIAPGYQAAFNELTGSEFTPISLN